MTALAAAPRLAALVGNPNAGKTSLFNALTGARQKVGNYPGVTVERKAGRLALPDGRTVDVVDLPGAYSLTPRSPDEEVTRRMVLGEQAGDRRPDAIVAVVDATNLASHLRFVLELKRLGLPMVVALNMVDLAERDGLKFDLPLLSARLGLPVIPTVAVRKRGLADLAQALLPLLSRNAGEVAPRSGDGGGALLGIANPDRTADLRALQREAAAIARAATLGEGGASTWTRRLDQILLHPFIGPALLALILFTMFQAVFATTGAPTDWLNAQVDHLAAAVSTVLAPGALRSLIVDGVLHGVGAVIVFLPQILVLFLFIMVLEQSGYMVRAAFLMDRVMARVGLSGRAFIPLLSSFACAIPGIMATRTIEEPRDRLTTILVAPLMTCSARLPVYAVIIAAFIPDTRVAGFLNLQGLVLFGLYVTGVVGALVAAWALRRTLTQGANQLFMMELPKYQWPHPRDIAIGLLGRAKAFLYRAGTTILASNVVLWFLASYPKPPAGSGLNPLGYSIAGHIGGALQNLFAPIGFNREISLALVPGMAAREVVVSALGTVYSLGSGDEHGLIHTLRHAWPLPTALAFLAWFVFAPQCISTLAVTRRETNGWKWPAFMFAYMFAAAYVAAGATYWLSQWALG